MAEVTREHRRLALLAHGVLERHVSAWSEWLAFGGDVFETCGHTHCMVDESATAQAIADAEQRGREAERRDVVAFASSRYATSMFSPSAAYAFRDGAHVGAAERGKGGE